VAKYFIAFLRSYMQLLATKPRQGAMFRLKPRNFAGMVVLR
jgi:hypothetical protein